MPADNALTLCHEEDLFRCGNAPEDVCIVGVVSVESVKFE